jgi:hypothetical protein
MKARFFVLLISLIASLLITLCSAAADPKGWIPINVSGFGDSENYWVESLTPFKDQLYAGTANWIGAQLWRRDSSGVWTQITASGFDNPDNTSIMSLANFKSRLYAGTRNDTSGGQVWRSDDGAGWSKVTLPGFDPKNEEVVHFAEFENEIYASTLSYTTTHGPEIWHSSTGNSGEWTRVVSSGFDGDLNNEGIVTFEEHGGKLFAGTLNRVTGAEVWSMDDTGAWSQLNADGFGDLYNTSVTLKGFDGYLYAGTYNYGPSDNFSDNPGHELWRCQTCTGSDWQMVPIPKGFGTTENRAIRAFETLNGSLFAVIYNRSVGTQVWRSADGENWDQVNTNGFGDSNNRNGHWDNASTVFNSSIYVGTENPAGGEIWSYLSNNVFLSVVVKGSQ